MKIMILGAGGFIGTNLAIRLAENRSSQLTLVDKKDSYFQHISEAGLEADLKISDFGQGCDYEILTKGQEVIYYLVSTTSPGNSNQNIPKELSENVVAAAEFLKACIVNKVKKVIFLSSGGTVYGLEGKCPISEETVAYPINSYGVQKLMIEKLFYLYHYLYGLEYKIIRLANPYGPYQRPNNSLGVVTNFVYQALKGEPLTIYGDGKVIRDFIYIDDVITAILNISEYQGKHSMFNLGSGMGSSIRQVVEAIEKTMDLMVDVTYLTGRTVDVPVNILDISRYESVFGEWKPISLEEGIRRTADFLKRYY